MPSRTGARPSEPRQTGELTHSSRWSWCPGLSTMPKNGSPSRRSMIAWSAPPDLADPERAVPLGDGLEVRRHEPVDVVADAVRQPARVLRHEPGPAVERAPDPERDGQRVAALDRAVAGAQQPEPRPRPGGEHQVARQRRPVPAEERDRLGLGHARTQARGAARRTPFEVRVAACSNAASWSTSLMTRSPSAGSIEQVVRVLDDAGRADERAQLVREVRGHLEPRPVRERLPADARRPASRARSPPPPGSRRAAATGRAAASAG